MAKLFNLLTVVRSLVIKAEFPALLVISMVYLTNESLSQPPL